MDIYFLAWIWVDSAAGREPGREIRGRRWTGGGGGQALCRCWEGWVDWEQQHLRRYVKSQGEGGSGDITLQRERNDKGVRSVNMGKGYMIAHGNSDIRRVWLILCLYAWVRLEMTTECFAIKTCLLCLPII